MKAYVINTGELHTEINGTFSNSVVATRSNPNPDTIWIVCPTYCVLIEHESAGWILFDTGCTPQYNELLDENIIEACYYVPEKGAAMIEQLQMLDLKPSDINHVILSHMHLDHLGNADLFADTAEFYVARAEAEHAFTTVMGSMDRADHGNYLRELVLMPMKKLHYIEEDQNLFSGIEAVLLPGHTPGSMGILLQMDDKNLFIVSDALAGYASYEGHQPGTVYDTLSWRKSLDKIKKIQRAYHAEIWFGHDAKQFRKLKKIPEHY